MSRAFAAAAALLTYPTDEHAEPFTNSAPSDALLITTLAASRTSSFFRYAPYPATPPPTRPAVAPVAAPTTRPAPEPTAAPIGIDSPKVNRAKGKPAAAPTAPPAAKPVAPAPAPTATAPAAAEAAVVWKDFC